MVISQGLTHDRAKLLQNDQNFLFEDNKMSVLFVCLGNICRSPMAEAVFKSVCESHNINMKIDSCGTASYHIGNSPDKRSISTCQSHGIHSIKKHRGQQLCLEHFDQFDWILCMDESNLEDILRLKPTHCRAQISLFGAFDPQGERVIEDPYYGGPSGFEHNFDQVSRCSLGFLNHLKFV